VRHDHLLEEVRGDERPALRPGVVAGDAPDLQAVAGGLVKELRPRDGRIGAARHHLVGRRLLGHEHT
jgi:hypothetical protein